MHPAIEERLRRENAAATVQNLATLNERIGTIETKLDRVMILLEAQSEAKTAKAKS